MKKLLMIINIHSGLKNSKNNLLEAIDVFCKHKYCVTTYIPQGINDAYEYIKKDKTKYDVVCAFGGDGTLNEVTNAIMTKKIKPMIGYFPSGTMNDFGSNFDLNKSFSEIAEDICSGKYKEFDVGVCNNKYFNYVAAFGAMTDVSYTTNRKAKEALGNLAYILKGISKLDEIKPIKVSYTINGKTKTLNAIFALIFSGGRVAGQQIIPKIKSKTNDGKFNVLIVEYVEGLFDIPDYLAIITQHQKYIHQYTVKEIEFEFDNKMTWDLDGEKAVFDKKVVIKNIPRALKLKAKEAH